MDDLGLGLEVRVMNRVKVGDMVGNMVMFMFKLRCTKERLECQNGRQQPPFNG